MLELIIAGALAASPAPAKAAPPIEAEKPTAVEFIADFTENCRQAVQASKRRDFDWLERRMASLGMSELGKARARSLCLFYLHGYQDRATEARGRR
ncbi:MAG TPA: hypothetical protein VF605_11750 [Allosphingosinicella sp.]|jgi:hypothetical protein